jgi:tetratricopeptide (TPR) repeat protein
MIEYLEKLVGDKEHAKAVRYAEQLLANRDNTPRDLLVIHAALLTSNYHSARYEQAIPSGHIVIPLASELEEWDYFGLACIDLGSAYYVLNQEKQALDWWLQYFTGVQYYKRAARREAVIWYNIGLAYNKLGEIDEASQAFARGIEAANRFGNTRFAHGIRQGFIDVCLKANRLEQIPRLLAQCGKYLRDHSDIESQLSYKGLRAKYALLTGRVSRARAVALNGMSSSDGQLEKQSELHLVLAMVAIDLGSTLESLGHASAAQALANKCHLQYLASEATQIIYEAVRNQSDVAARMDEYYLSGTERPDVFEDIKASATDFPNL